MSNQATIDQSEIIKSYLIKYLSRTIEQFRNDLMDFDKLMEFLPEDKRLEIIGEIMANKELIVEKLEKKFAEILA